MKTKRIVITGGPGSGKTTVVRGLEEKGFRCLHEISREVILAAQKRGIEQLFLTDPLLFSRKLLEGRVKQYEEADKLSEKILFYDRGLPDITAYMDYIGTPYPNSFNSACETYKYYRIFLLPPWKEIYTQDNERYETYEEARTIYKYLRQGYEKYGYEVFEVPLSSAEERVDFILNHLNNSG